MVAARRRPLSLAVVICLCGVGLSATAEEKCGLEEKLSKWTKSDKITLENKGYFRYWYDIQDSAVLRDGVSAETGVHAFTVRTQLTF